MEENRKRDHENTDQHVWDANVDIGVSERRGWVEGIDIRENPENDLPSSVRRRPGERMNKTYFDYESKTNYELERKKFCKWLVLCQVSSELPVELENRQNSYCQRSGLNQV